MRLPLALFVGLACVPLSAQVESQLPILFVPESHQGSSVAGTHDLVVTGAPDGGPFGLGTPGAATVFRPSGSVWLPTLLPTPPEISAGDRFGHAVTVNEAGTIIAVGAPLNDTTAVDGGLVTIYRWNAGTQSFDIDEVLRGIFPSGLFGSSLAIDGECLAVGEPTGGFGNGTVNIFCRNAGTGAWVNDGFFLGAAFLDGFGWSVGLDDDTLIVGSPFASGGAGRADIFEKTGTWQNVYTATASFDDEQFGAAVAIDGHDAIIGVPGYNGGPIGILGRFVMLGRSPVTGWTTVGTPSVLTTWSNPDLGFSVALSNGVALVGGPGAARLSLAMPDLGDDAGFVFVMRSNGDFFWSYDGAFSATDVAPGDRYGAAVGFAGDQVVIGAPFSEAFGPDVGAAYVRRIDGAFSTTTVGAGTGASLSLDSLGGGNAVLRFSASGGTCNGTGFPFPISSMLVIGFDLLNAPFKGGTLVPSPTVISDVTLICLVSTAAQSYETLWPTGLPDLSFYAQLWVPDTAAASGWASSPGLLVTADGD